MYCTCCWSCAFIFRKSSLVLHTHDCINDASNNFEQHNVYSNVPWTNILLAATEKLSYFLASLVV